jgi:phosphoglycolate phosphatase
MSPPLRAIRAVIFDLDGTLVDSLGDIATHINAALVDCGHAARPLDVVQSHVGHGARALVARVLGDGADVDAVYARFGERYRERPVIETRVYPGLDGALDAIAPGRRLAVLSNKPHDLTVTIGAALLVRWPFAPVVGQRAGVAIKPDPAAALAIAAELGVPPAACAFVGDSEVDVATGRAAGMPTVAVAWGLRTPAVLRAAGADHLVDTPAALAALF